jgi:RHS repeat-associated protein
LSRAPLDSDPPSTAKHFDYDVHGNMIRMPHLPLMQWDYRDQLQATAQQVVINGSPETTWYVYNSSGLRVRKVTDNASNVGNASKKEERIYLGGFEIYRKNGMNPLVRETLHIMDDKQRIALVETRTLPTTPIPNDPLRLTRYQFGNHLGSAALELDDQAQVISYEEYSPYGSPTYQAVRSQTETPKRYRYTGMERDEESGFDYHGARYYATWLGRWVSADPLVATSDHTSEGIHQKGSGDSANQDSKWIELLSESIYTFCKDNPICHIDLSGCLPLKAIPQIDPKGKLHCDRPWKWNSVEVYAYGGCLVTQPKYSTGSS